jgi:hypothetical protein
VFLIDTMVFSELRRPHEQRLLPMDLATARR